MTASAAPVSDRRQLRRVAAATCIGTTIEWYDYFIYGTAAALVFPVVLFPALGEAAATVASFATLGIAFIVRPFGSVLFGHFGDRMGRKASLVATLVVMGSATVLIGLVPSAATIGVAAPVLVIALRILQGLSVGGEWAAATVFAVEHAPEGKRGMYAVFPQLGPALGFFISSGTYLATTLWVSTSDKTFLSYGWRVPFVASLVLVAVGAYARLKIAETPVFREAQGQARRGPTKTPFRELMRSQARAVLLSGGLTTILFALFYIATAYMTNLGTTTIGLSTSAVLAIGMGGAIVLALGVIVSGPLSDRIGRRKVIVIAYSATVPSVLVSYALMSTGSVVVFGATLALTLGLYGLAYGPVGAYLPELFDTRYRFTGAGVGYNLGGIVGGAIVPLVAVEVGSRFGPYAVGIMLACVSVVSLLSTLMLRETRFSSLNDESSKRHADSLVAPNVK